MTAALMLLAASTASAASPEFRISHFGADGDLDQQAGFPAAAYDPQSNTYLVVYEAGGNTSDEWKIYGQRLDASGAALGGAFQISVDDGNKICSYNPPSVGNNPVAGEFLVAWVEGNASTCDGSIRVQRVNSAGAKVGAPSAPISGPVEDVETIAVGFSPVANEWLVAWKGVDGSGQAELWSQRLSADGAEVGEDDQRLTTFADDGGYANDAMDLAYDSRDDRYLVVVRARDDVLAPDGEFEAYGHLMSSDGTQIGPNQIRISDIAATNPDGEVAPPSVSYDPVTDRFLVAWMGNAMVDAMINNEREIFGRLVDGNGNVLGSADTRYSDMGPDGDTNYAPLRPDIGFDSNAGEFFMAWQGDDDTSPLVADESEVFGQRVGGDGTELGDNDFRITSHGPEGDPKFPANRPALAYNSTNCQFLVVWQTGGVGNFPSDEEWDIWGNLVDSSAPCVKETAPPPPPPSPQPAPSFGAKTAISVKLSSSKIRPHGPLKVRIRNRNAFAVSGRLSGKTAKLVTGHKRHHKRSFKLGSKRFSVGAGGNRTVKLSLPKALRKLLAHRRKLSIRLIAKVRDPAGHRRTVTDKATVKIKQKRKKRKKRTRHH